MVDLLTGQMRRNKNRIARILKAVQAFAEQNRKFGNLSFGLFGMPTVVEPDSENLSRPERCEKFAYPGGTIRDLQLRKQRAGKFNRCPVWLLRPIVFISASVQVTNDFHDFSPRDWRSFEGSSSQWSVRTNHRELKKLRRAAGQGKNLRIFHGGMGLPWRRMSRASHFIPNENAHRHLDSRRWGRS